MSEYTSMELGPLDAWHALDGAAPGKVFLDRELGATNSGVSVNGLAAGQSSPFWHRHARTEEVYVFLGGTGRMALGDEVVEVREGSAVRVAPNTWMAVHADADSATDLRFVCVRAAGVPLAEIGNDAEISHEPFPWA